MVIKVFLICLAMFLVGWRVGKWLKSIAEKHYKELEKIDHDLKEYVNEQKKESGNRRRN